MAKTQHKTAAVLLHYPITSRTGQTIHTSVTNLDVHDIARSCRTYEIDHYYIVTPIGEQKEMVGRIIGHWDLPTSKEYHPDRFAALRRVQVVSTFADVKADLNARYPGQAIETTMPDARPLPNQLSYNEIREHWAKEAAPGVKIVVFGTGWGVAPEFHSEVQTFLAPIYGPLGKDGYNHLSVRAAVAIILDRLFGIN